MGNAIVGVSAPTGVITPGEQFTVVISVVPNNAIAGMQFNLAFNPAVATAVSVTEGNLLNQEGANTYFNTGNINNQNGTITGVFGAIINPGQNTSAQGNFAVITMTASATGGNSPLTLSNVVVGNVASQSVPTDVTNGTVTVGQLGGTPPVGGGGGGGATSSGGGAGAAGITSLRTSTTADGRTFEEVTASDITMQVQLRIPSGTMVKNEVGQPATSIRIIPLGDTLAADPGSTVISQSFDIEQSGTTFDGPATLIFRYYSLVIPAGVPEANFYIGLWDPAANKWKDLGGVVDINNRTVSIPIQHLSTYALMAHTRPASFEISKLTISLPEVKLGETVTASATITNRGDLSGTYKISLTLDNSIVETKDVTLNGGGEAPVNFTLTPDAVGEHQVDLGDLKATFQVKQPLSPAAFAVNGLNISPLQSNPGEEVVISANVKNNGDMSGSYQAVLVIDDANVESREITLDGGASQTVTFNLIVSTAGMHKASVGSLIAPFEVKIPAPPVTPVVTPRETALELTSFSAAPLYDETTGKLIDAKIAFQMNENWEAFPDSRLMLTVFHNNQFLEQVPLFALSQRQPDVTSGEFSYVPSAGWEVGDYAFRAELYEGDLLVQDTPLKTLDSTNGSAAVISWKTLGMIIGVALVIGTIIVTVVLYFRRDMLQDYWK